MKGFVFLNVTYRASQELENNGKELFSSNWKMKNSVWALRWVKEELSLLLLHYSWVLPCYTYIHGFHLYTEERKISIMLSFFMSISFNEVMEEILLLSIKKLVTFSSSLAGERRVPAVIHRCNFTCTKPANAHAPPQTIIVGTLFLPGRKGWNVMNFTYTKQQNFSQ